MRTCPAASASRRRAATLPCPKWCVPCDHRITSSMKHAESLKAVATMSE